MGVAILMNGGPGTVWGPRAYAAFAEFAGGRQPQGCPRRLSWARVSGTGRFRCVSKTPERATGAPRLAGSE
jgi:hypothetical protein